MRRPAGPPAVSVLQLVPQHHRQRAGPALHAFLISPALSRIRVEQRFNLFLRGGQYKMGSPGNRGSGATEHHSGQQSSMPLTQTGTGQASTPQEHSSGSVTAAVKDKAHDIASAVASKAEDAWDSTKHGAEQAASAVATTAADAWQEVTGIMRRYPFATLWVGIAAGFVLSRLFEDRGARSFGRRSWGYYPPDFGPEYRSNAERR
jgi:ElaB/YqjD/DUF883 family membrane-anchored ribosome-binding protein